MHVREDSILTPGLAGARRRRSLLPTALLPMLAALLALTLAACGGSDDDSAEAEKPKEPATTSSAEQTTSSAEQTTSSAEQTTSSAEQTKPSALTATITGTITFGAEARREPQVLNMEADPVCAEKNSEDPKTEQAFLLDESKGLANVLVQVKSGLPDVEFAAAEPEVIFSQSGCLYDPHVVIIRVDQTVKILNPDGTLHNVHVVGKVNQEFNQAMPKFQAEIERVFDKVEADPFLIKCDVHPWMIAFGVVLDHPYAAVTAADGTFSIPNLPAGTYQVEVWHELLGSQTHEVTVSEGGTAALDMALQPPS